jgi:polyribonucleotide nucleotidyltransferase
MISDITAVPEAGKTYLGKVVRLAEFGAFVEIFPGTDGLLHVSEIAEHRVKEVKDELREGDQILVKVIALEGNRIKLSRKAVLREQREKLGLPPVAEQSGGGERSSSSEPRRERGDRDRGPRGDRDRDRGPRPERTEPRAEQPKPQETIVLDSEDFDDEDDDFEGDDEGTQETAVTTPANGSAPPAGGAPTGQRRGRRRRGRRPGAPAPQGGSN